MESQRVRHDWAASLTLLWSKVHKSEHWEWSQVDRNVSLVHRMFSIVFFFFFKSCFFLIFKKKKKKLNQVPTVGSTGKACVTSHIPPPFSLWDHAFEEGQKLPF